MLTLEDLAKRVKKGATLLDKKIPNWRAVIRRRETEFEFANGDHCVLGTLEHHSGRMRVLAKRKKAPANAISFSRAATALGIPESTSSFGFDVEVVNGGEYLSADARVMERRRQYDILTALWRAEIGL